METETKKNMDLVGAAILFILFTVTKSSLVLVDYFCDQCSPSVIAFALNVSAEHPVDVVHRLEDSIALYIYTTKDSEPDVIVPTNVTEFPLNKLIYNSRLKIVIHGFGSSYSSFFSQQVKNGTSNTTLFRTG